MSVILSVNVPPLSEPMAVGAPAMLRLAERWSPAPVRAAALLRRVDVVGGVLDITGACGLCGLRDGEDDDRVRQARATLPAASLLVLDEQDAVHLVGLRDGPFQLHHGATLREWPDAEMHMRIRPGTDGLFRAVEIDDMVVAAPWQSARQRAALELIEQLTR